MGRRLSVVGISLLALFLAGCVSSYEVEWIRAHELIQDMEAIELDEPDHPPDLPETGIVVNNHTARTLVVKLRRKEDEFLTIPPGASDSVPLVPGTYHYRIYQDPTADEPKTKAVYIDLSGTKKIVEKCVFVYDVFTEREVVSERRFREIRSR